MVIFYKKSKNYNEIQLTKNKMDLNNQKMTNHPPSPIIVIYLEDNCVIISMHQEFITLSGFAS